MGLYLKKNLFILITIVSILLSNMVMASEKNVSSFPSFSEEFSMLDNSGVSSSEFLSAKKAFSPSLWIEGDTLFIGFDIEDDYYLYRDRIRIFSRDDGFKFNDISLTKGEEITDEFFGDVFIYEGKAIISAEIETEIESFNSLPVTLTFQGCAKAGLCYPIENVLIEVKQFYPPNSFIEAYQSFIYDDNLIIAENKDNLNNVEENLPSNEAYSVNNLNNSFDRNYISLFVIFFLIGIGLSFTPCVLPMLPILSSIIVGRGSDRKQAFKLSASYSIGVILIYTLFGVIIGLVGTGLNIQAYLQSPYVVIPIAIIFTLFSLIMFGFINLSSILGGTGEIGAKITDLQSNLSKAGALGSMFAGMLSVMVLSPCVSAPLAGVLVYISTTGDVLTGAITLLAMSMGMSVLLILAGTFGVSSIPKAGAWMQNIKNIFGFMLLGMSVWVVGYLINPILYQLLLFAIIILIMVQVWDISNFINKKGILHYIIKSIAILITMIAISHTMATINAYQIKSDGYKGVSNSFYSDVYSLEEIKERTQNGKYIVYFSADWCVSCRQIERNVFGSNELRDSYYNNNISVLKVDVTRNNEKNREILTEYNIFGPPSFLLIVNGELIDVVQGEINLEQGLGFVKKISQK